MKRITALLLLCAVCFSCSEFENTLPDFEPPLDDFTLGEVAKILSSLPLGPDQLQEVYDASSSSSVNGYDEEYTLSDLLTSPGSGVGDDPERASLRALKYKTPLKDLFEEYFERNPKSFTKGGSAGAQECLRRLKETDFQIYTPYSDKWDGESYPIITFDPGYGAESNFGYEICFDDEGARIVDSVYVDENIARSRPVWVINNNDDSAFTPMEMVVPLNFKSSKDGLKSMGRTLLLKSITMLRNYDSWFGGASEFFIKCGSASGFKGTTDEDLKQFSPSLTDFMIVVKRQYLGVEIPLDAVMVSDFTSQMDKLAFLMIEDDGGSRTEWKCQATVKVNSKAYGFDINIPYNEKDDIVWRGQLAASFFQSEDIVGGRFGDVRVTFALE